MTTELSMRDKITDIVGDPDVTDQILQLFAAIYSYETPPLDDPDLQPEAPGVMYSYRTVRWESPTEPAPNPPPADQHQ